ncbi:MAG: transposase [Deltaproteobacteria bacterium]|nr:transposase [Deltaproteobacteria bacterium]
MARKPRVEFAGAFYHVICRGNQRQTIFHSDVDRSHYLDRLEQYRERYGFTVYAYVLMTNHVHLLIETGKVPLSKIMQGLQFTYTRYYNREYGKVGHLFQGRYKAILCDRESYLLELVRYLHLNPARMRRRLDPWRYRWSSHGAYLGKDSPVKVETSVVLGELGKVVGRARRAYLRFMAEGRDMGHQENYYRTVDQRFLGDRRFVEEIDQRSGAEREIEVPGPRASFSDLVRLLGREHGVSGQELVRAGRKRQWVRVRSMLVYLAREWARMSVRELGRRLHRDPSIISRLYAAYGASRDVAGESRLVRQLRQ